MSSIYEYSLSLSSQFYFCPLPLRLDSYNKCTFGCIYCFANCRGGNYGHSEVAQANPEQLRRRLERLTKNRPNSAIDEFLLRRQPIHFGGMSDPFIPYEREAGVTLSILKVLADFEYPTIISTKGSIIIHDEYLKVLSTGNFIVQVSISTLNEDVASIIEPLAPSSKQRLEVLAELCKAGITSTCRIQPIIPAMESDALELIEACSSVGVSHISAEYLKLGIDKTMGEGAKEQIEEWQRFFKKNNAYRSGREWLLPSNYKLKNLLKQKAFCKLKGLSFGCGENDLIALGNSKCCCLPAVVTPSFENFFKYTYSEAIRRGFSTKTVSIGNIESEWRPERPISKYINSKVRTKDGTKNTIENLMKKAWNSCNVNSPASHFGVTPTRNFDSDGYILYDLSEDLIRINKES